MCSLGVRFIKYLKWLFHFLYDSIKEIKKLLVLVYPRIQNSRLEIYCQ